MSKANYSEIRTILQDNEYEPEAIVDVVVIGDNNYNVIFIEASIVKYVTIRGRNCDPWIINKDR